MDYPQFFQKAFGAPDKKPLPYQTRLATAETWPDILHIPTGLGKTAAVTLAWLFKRIERNDPATPRRLIWCLPMRVLVEQTEENIRTWLAHLGLDQIVGVHLLMGGSKGLLNASWAEQPEKAQILIGTQDMLLSRALMRGYGMSRYSWPIHFAFLHNDAIWVFDEIQLMGPALTTTAQLEAFRRQLPLAKGSRSLWVSATLKKEWLGTVDLKEYLNDFGIVELGPKDVEHSLVHKRVQAQKMLRPSRAMLNKESAKQRAKIYLDQLAIEILENHRPGTQTLVVLNRVERAQDLFKRISKSFDGHILLLHARFRHNERRGIERRLKNPVESKNRIVISTQAIEAGVDVSSHTLFTELAPWSSLVQRFGRCNRYGETDGAHIFFMDMDETAEALPYEAETLAKARAKLAEVIQNGGMAGPGFLPKVDESSDPSLILRKRDFLDLFNTDPDLSGQDIDISPYIRDSGTPQVTVFWRGFKDKPEEQLAPVREELCPASISQIKDALKTRNGWIWDSVSGSWNKVDAYTIKPGDTLLLRSMDGGYDLKLGFFPKSTEDVEEVENDRFFAEESLGNEDLTLIGRFVELAEHLSDAGREGARLCDALQQSPEDTEVVVESLELHDWGKAHEAFQNMMTQAQKPPEKNKIWAKSARMAGKPDYRMTPFEEAEKGVARPHFRHELASMLAWLEKYPAHPKRDLIAYLIAAHHGKVRMGLRAWPKENKPKDGRLFARGIWQGDRLPAVPLSNGNVLPETELHLDLMRLGDGPMGPSWTSRTLGLLRTYGPFYLAWLESLVRISDWRASRLEAMPVEEGSEYE